MERSHGLLGDTKGTVFVVSAPSGAGKTTLVTMLLQEFPEAIAQSCSMTTRHKREQEIGSYYFVSVKEFQKHLEQDAFLEYTHIFGHYYGTLREEVRNICSTKHAILVLDTQGALKLKQQMDVVSIFITVPSLQVLEERLLHRGERNPQEIKTRLARASQEMEMIKYYDYSIMNKDLKISYEILRSIIIAQAHRRYPHGTRSYE